MPKYKTRKGEMICPFPPDTVECKAWSILSQDMTLNGAAQLRRDSYGTNEEWRILKDLLMMGIAFALLFTAFNATANLQSSVHAEVSQKNKI